MAQAISIRSAQEGHAAYAVALRQGNQLASDARLIDTGFVARGRISMLIERKLYEEVRAARERSALLANALSDVNALCGALATAMDFIIVTIVAMIIFITTNAILIIAMSNVTASSSSSNPLQSNDAVLTQKSWVISSINVGPR